MASHRDKDLTDSQRDLAAIVEQAAEVGASRGYEQQRQVTPTPVMTRGQRTGDSSEMYEIAERVVERNRPREWIECERHGPAFKLGQRIDRVDEHLNHVDERVRAMEFAHTEERGANREIARQAASRTALQTLAISGAIGIASLLLSAGINRIWPQRQPAAITQPAQGK